MDENEEERRNVSLLLKWIGGFIAWPALTIGLAFVLIDASEHMLHVVGLLPLGAAGVAVLVFSRKIATKFYPVLEA